MSVFLLRFSSNYLEKCVATQFSFVDSNSYVLLIWHRDLCIQQATPLNDSNEAKKHDTVKNFVFFIFPLNFFSNSNELFFFHLFIISWKYTQQFPVLAYSLACRGGRRTLEHKVIQQEEIKKRKIKKGNKKKKEDKTVYTIQR